MTLDLDSLSRKTGLVVRSLYSAALNNLLAGIEEYGPHERAETFDYLAGALNQVARRWALNLQTVEASNSASLAIVDGTSFFEA
jgi:hypothetical protein